jgi:hypothetical protein
MRTRHCGLIATLLLGSAALITNAVAQPHRGGGGGGGAPHVSAPHVSAPHMSAPRVSAPHFSAPAARAAPHFAAPHVAAPHMAGPRAAPHVAGPRFSPHFSAHRAGPAITHRNAGPSFRARGAHGPGAHGPRNVARHGITPSTRHALGSRHNAVGNAANRRHERNGRNGIGNAANRLRDRNGRNGVGNAANRLHDRNGRNNPAGNAANRLRDRNGRGAAGAATTGSANANLATRQGRGHNRILRNSALSNLASRTPRARNLANSTFRGRFARSTFGRDWDRRHHRHHHFGFVLGFVGPLFWPYAYDDLVDYTFLPDAYDTFWPYAYDDVYEGLYGAYAPQYGATYAYAGAPASSTAYRRGTSTSTGGGGGAAQVCSDRAQGLTDFPIEQISRQVNPDQNQQGLLDDLKAATAKAINILQAACPNDLPSTPTGRLAAMHVRVQAMLQAVQTVRPALDKFYNSLSDEQKERFNALDQNAYGSAPQPDVAQLCNDKRSSPASLPVAEIEKSLRLSNDQGADLKALEEASAKSADILNANCPTGETLTPPGRVAAMEQRLSGMLQAIETVRPALNKFYGSLNDEQKARFDRLGRKRT